jgi:hypothetical protein
MVGGMAKLEILSLQMQAFQHCLKWRMKLMVEVNVYNDLQNVRNHKRCDYRQMSSQAVDDQK